SRILSARRWQAIRDHRGGTLRVESATCLSPNRLLSCLVQARSMDHSIREWPAIIAPGVIFAEDDDVIPDIVWASSSRFATIFGPEGHLHAAPELTVEVLSPDAANEKRDREIKLNLYSRRGVHEYRIVDWTQRRTEVFRREQEQLKLTATLMESDILTTPLLPAFACPLADIFNEIPADPTAPPTISSHE